MTIRDDIALAYEGEVMGCAIRFRRGNEFLEFWDLVQAGNEGLVLAMATFDLDRNIKFRTWATNMIKFKMLRYIRDERKARGMKYDDRVGNPSGSHQSLGVDFNVMVQGYDFSVEIRCELAKVMKSANMKELDVIEKRLEGWTNIEISKELGITRSAVRQRLIRLGKRIRRDSE